MAFAGCAWAERRYLSRSVLHRFGRRRIACFQRSGQTLSRRGYVGIGSRFHSDLREIRDNACHLTAAVEAIPTGIVHVASISGGVLNYFGFILHRYSPSSLK
jgi:hypothetical protein